MSSELTFEPSRLGKALARLDCTSFMHCIVGFVVSESAGGTDRAVDRDHNALAWYNTKMIAQYGHPSLA